MSAGQKRRRATTPRKRSAASRRRRPTFPGARSSREQFVRLNEIDPVQFDKSYYMAPGYGAGADRPYWLLYKAMEAAAEVAVGRFVMRTKEYLAAVRPGEHLLMLETLFYADEVRDPKEIWMPQFEVAPERELRVARQLIDALTGEWDPARHRDEYRETRSMRRKSCRSPKRRSPARSSI
jgi:DNA end-binding protein Ku